MGFAALPKTFYIGKTGWHESHSHSRRAERGKRVTEAHCTALAQPWHSDGSAAFPPSSPCYMGALRQLSLAPHLSHKLLPILSKRAVNRVLRGKGGGCMAIWNYASWSMQRSPTHLRWDSLWLVEFIGFIFPCLCFPSVKLEYHHPLILLGHLMISEHYVQNPRNKSILGDVNLSWAREKAEGKH